MYELCLTSECQCQARERIKTTETRDIVSDNRLSNCVYIQNSSESSRYTHGEPGLIDSESTMTYGV